MGAVFKEAPHPNAGMLFLAWLLEPEQQAGPVLGPRAMTCRPLPGYRPIFSYKVVNGYQGFLLNETQVVQLRKRFEAYTGPVVNAGGVR